MFYRILFILSFVTGAFSLNAQDETGRVSGTITDKNTLRPLAGISISVRSGTRSIQDSGLINSNGGLSDSAGFFRLSALAPGTYNLGFTSVGYRPFIYSNIVITSGNENVISVELEPLATELSSVVVTGRRNTVRAASIESPLSVQKLTTEEIKRNPGGNFDISKVVQSLPGVGGGVGGGGFRNDIIIRGGAPSENVFYLDGIEIPVLNHFGTQGSGGGPQGILNANFIEEVKVSSSAFDARYDNALSSVLQFRQKSGNTNRTQGNFLLSATELALTLDGPLSKNTTYLASVRRSYLQFLFQLIDLPIRPNYWDYQLKITSKLNDKTTLNFIGIGAIDEFKFAAPKEATPEKLCVINSNPIINQWNYTVGVSLRRLLQNGYLNIALSRNTLNNNVEKFEDNDFPSPQTQTLLTDSRETENKLRIDVTKNISDFKLSYGASAQYVDFKNNFFSVFRKEVTDENGNVIQPGLTIDSRTNTDFLRYGAFVQVSKRFFDNRLSLSAGTRVDGNSAENGESNPLKQFSPRVSASYTISDLWNLNASVGRYFKIPSYTQIAFETRNQNILTTNPAAYIESVHYVAGTEFIPSNSFRATLEGFYKKYSDYPVSIYEGISLANKGGEFGSIGNEPIAQNGEGRAYGFEVLLQQKLSRNFFGLLSYTWYKSEFTGIDGRYIPAAWDNRHLLSITAGYKFGRNWELGLKFRYQGKAPYTPFDLISSRANYLSQGTGILAFDQYNSLRLRAFNSSNLRVDKKWNFSRFTLNVFIDISNWYGSEVAGLPQYTFQRNADNTAFATTDGQPLKQDGSNAIPVILTNSEVSVTPTFGFIVEF
ncbi:MAG: TonB-dependent receptor [Flavitalea sp.]